MCWLISLHSLHSVKGNYHSYEMIMYQYVYYKFKICCCWTFPVWIVLRKIWFFLNIEYALTMIIDCPLPITYSTLPTDQHPAPTHTHTHTHNMVILTKFKVHFMFTQYDNSIIIHSYPISIYVCMLFTYLSGCLELNQLYEVSWNCNS